MTSPMAGATHRPVGLATGVPPWIEARARELVPNAHERMLHLSNAPDLMRIAVQEVERWMQDPEFVVVRWLDLVEFCCGQGGITTTCLYTGMHAIGFDRLC